MLSSDNKAIDFGCPKGEAVFSLPVFDNSDLDVQNTNQLLEEYVKHVAELRDDRLLALTANLLIEHSVNSYLSVIMPKYEKEISNEHRTFTLAVKISAAKALRLSPTKLFDNALLINEIRNQFAHNVKLKKFSDLPKEKLERIDKALNLLNFDQTTNDVDGKFRILTLLTIIGLNKFTHSVDLLYSFLRSEKFSDNFVAISLMLK